MLTLAEALLRPNGRESPSGPGRRASRSWTAAAAPVRREVAVAWELWCAVCPRCLEREYAEELDAADPLAGFRDRFALDDPCLIYLNGNSLGALPRATLRRLEAVIREEWGTALARSWDHWVDLPGRAGNLVGELTGAAPGQVLVADNTTVNLYKLACAALDARPGRHVIVTDRDNFPSDRYVVEGIAAERGARAAHAGHRHRPGPGRRRRCGPRWMRTPRWSACPTWRTAAGRWPTWRPSPRSCTRPAR